MTSHLLGFKPRPILLPSAITCDHILRASQSKIVQITQRKVGAQRSNERMNGGTEKERSQRLTLLWALLGHGDMLPKQQK